MFDQILERAQIIRLDLSEAELEQMDGHEREKCHARYCHVEGVNSVQVPSRRGSSRCINGYLADRSGIGEVYDNNTGEVEVRELVQVFSVMCGAG